MTRAENTLDISFSESDNNRPKLPSLFVRELGVPIVPSSIEADPEVLLARNHESYYHMTLETADLQFIARFFQNYSLSPTDLTRFTQNPAEFLQRSILRYPFEDTLPTMFGTAFHRALEVYYKTWKSEKSRPEVSVLMETFEKIIARFYLSK